MLYDIVATCNLSRLEAFFLPGEPVTFLNLHWWSAFFPGATFSLLEKGCGIKVDRIELPIAVLHFRSALVSNELMFSKHGYTLSIVINVCSSSRSVCAVRRCKLLSEILVVFDRNILIHYKLTLTACVIYYWLLS